MLGVESRVWECKNCPIFVSSFHIVQRESFDCFLCPLLSREKVLTVFYVLYCPERKFRLDAIPFVVLVCIHGVS